MRDGVPGGGQWERCVETGVIDFKVRHFPQPVMAQVAVVTRRNELRQD